MNASRSVAVVCTLAQSAFSGERVFKLPLADGSDYAGIAPVGYCRKADGSAIGRDEPAAGQQIPGMVDAILAGYGDSQVRVALPNGEAIIVGPDRVCERQIKETQEYVPLRPGLGVGS